MSPLRRILASTLVRAVETFRLGTQRASSGSKRWSMKATSCLAPDRTEVS
jgi:hypothetical protein